MTPFDEAYRALNPEQKRAVDTIDGPVMVIAGPGTGKTQVLALRIANILIQTDIGANGILCLTFTNSGVYAMRERLKKYIGQAAGGVKVSTFHSFAQALVEKHFELLGFETMPKLLDEQASVLLFDEILHGNDWQYLRPRNNPSQYFTDLKSLISLLKREQLSSADFGAMIEREIEVITNDPNAISSRGETKGQLKKESQAKIESLKRSKEAGVFFELYERQKRDRSFMDYDDVLAYALEIVRSSDDVRATLREENQYVLIDEHQDSSGIQNEFLKAIWQGTDRPNIFVVGDDRQLIYGFGGASISYFEEFKHVFGEATRISLVENYRSTQKILDTADALLQSSLTAGALKSNTEDMHDIALYPCEYERDEILLAGKLFKDKIAGGIPANECALLVPKNKHVRSATRILRDMGLMVSAGHNTSFFDLDETQIFKAVLSVVANPYDSVAIGELLFAPTSGVAPLEAHAFLRSSGTRDLSLADLLAYTKTKNADDDLFSEANPIRVLGKHIESWMAVSAENDLYTLIQTIGRDYLIDPANDHERLVRRVEIVRTYLHLAVAHLERSPRANLAEFIGYIDRLESYNYHIPLAGIGQADGVTVATLHGSKGLEFQVVHIAHVNENSLMGGKRRGFTLPESIESLAENKDELTAKRELYVALTRAKRFCSLSYAAESLTGASLEAAHILSDLHGQHLTVKTVQESIEIIAGDDPKAYVESNPPKESVGMTELVRIMAREYSEKNVSVTLLNNFFECPWKWYFSSFLQLPTPKTESLILGTVVHAGIETILTDKLEPSTETIDAVVTKSLDRQLVRDKLLRTRLGKHAKTILTNWAAHYYPQIHKHYTPERSVSYHDTSLPHLKMYGKIDLTENLKEGILVTDFKTGNSKTKGVIEKRDGDGRLSPLLRQLAMYSYLLTGQKVRYSRLLFLEEDPQDKNATYTTTITDEEINLLVRDIREYDRLLKSGEWVKGTCTSKSHTGQTQQCQYCTLAAKIYGNPQ